MIVLVLMAKQVKIVAKKVFLFGIHTKKKGVKVVLTYLLCAVYC